VSVWVPPGSWTDWFTGTTYSGPATVTITAPLSRMPVLVRGGGIVPTRTDYVDYGTQRALGQVTLNVAAGADGDFALYQDAGEGAGYRSGQSTSTPLSWRDGSRTLTIGATTGTYPGAVSSRSYTLRLQNSVAPTAVFLDGVQLPETAWAYNTGRRVVTVTTGPLGSGAAHTISLSGSATANPATGEVIGAGNLCLDVRGGTAAEGQPLQLYTCNHTAAQQVGYQSDRTVRMLGRCIAPSGTGNNALVSTVTCTGGTGQTWTRQSDGTLVNIASGRCLDVPNGNTTPGAVQLQLFDCNTSAAQRWQLPPGPLAGPGGLCGDVADADPSSATPLQLYTCNRSDAQRFSAPGDRSVRVFGKCLDARGGGTGNGTPVQLWDCNGTGSQTWVTRADGTILNP